MLVTNREGKGKFHSSMSNLLHCLLPSMVEKACHTPYSITSRASLILSPPPPTSVDPEKNKSLSRRKTKKMGGSTEMLNVGGTQQRGRGVGSPQTTPDGKSKAVGGVSDKTIKRSVSSETGLSSISAGFRLPEHVLVFPVLEKLEESSAQWDFYLLTEEEVRQSGYHCFVVVVVIMLWGMPSLLMCCHVLGNTLLLL